MERDIMVRNDSGQFEEVDQEDLADELIAERFGYTTEEIQDMVDNYERWASSTFFGRFF